LPMIGGFMPAAAKLKPVTGVGEAFVADFEESDPKVNTDELLAGGKMPPETIPVLADLGGLGLKE